MALTEKEEKTELYTSSLIQALNYYGAASRLTQQARLEISNDESKIQLAGLEYSTFAKTIEAAYLAYDVTADNAYLELAFHNSEQLKSSAVFDKLSNDLAQENSLIPDSLIQKEKKLNSIISLYNQKKFEENSRELPDSVLIEEYTTKILEERNNKPDTLLVAEYNHKIVIEKKKQRPDSTLIDLYSNKIFEENRRSPDSLLMAEYFNKILEEKQKGPDSTLIDEYDQIIFAANKEREELNHMLEEEYADYYNLKYSKNMLSAEEIQQQMDDDEAIFEYVIVDPDKESGKETDADTTSQLYTFLITKEKLIFQRKSIEENTQESIENVFSFMSSSAYLFTKNSDSKAFCTASNKLYNLLVAPYEKELLNKNLVFIPDGQLNYISFDGLLMSLPDTSKTINFSKLDYLIKDYNINYANSANILFQNRGLRKKLSNKTLAFAPEYDSRKFEMSNDTFILAPLPGVQKEVSSIASTVKTKIFRGKDATEQNFRANSKHYDILHLAMHAYINDSQPAFSRLAFSPSLPGEEKDINEDGWLNTSDIYTLELNARLAVLSACNTGVGKLRKGEGMMSLARGFLYAGCPSIIMSLWEVEDKSGTHIMSSFYKNLKKGKTKDQALRLAKLEYLNQSNSRLAHPHYWMSFKSIGDNSQIYTSYDIYFFAMLIVLMLAFTIDQTLRIRKVRKQKQDY